MNRTILIVICDFLLVSLLAFSSVDINKAADDGAERRVKVDIATNQMDSRQDLGAVMRLALDEERKNRDVLLGELNKTREAASQQQALASERDKQVQAFQQELRSREQQTQQLQQKQKQLQQQFAAAQNNIQTLNQQLQRSAGEAFMSREKLAAMEAEAKKRQEDASALQQQLAQLTRSNQLVLSEKQQLAGQLQLAEAEKRFATEQVSHMREEVKVEREEKAKLAEGVKALASKSSQLTQEIQENRPLAANTIFDEFVTNRVKALFNATRPGFMGLESNKEKESETVLVTDGSRIFALGHVQGTPLTFWDPGTDWEALTATLVHKLATSSVKSLSFHLADPRVVLMPVTDVEARNLGCKVYKIASDPFKFQDAVVIGTQDSYYGECKFQIDLSTPQYVKMDRNSLKGLFGKFNPSRGDLVFSKRGELIGVMANGTYCMKLQNFDTFATFQFGPDVRAQKTGKTLRDFYYLVLNLPFKLQ